MRMLFLCLAGLFVTIGSGFPTVSVGEAYDLKDLRNREATRKDYIDIWGGTRSIVPVPSGEKSGEKPGKIGVAIDVMFEFDSARLTPDARRNLDELGGALQSAELIEDSFLIEGHTDSTGGHQYNRTLSIRRAQSVKAYLVSALGVDSNRLETVGRGETRLLDKENPTSAKNRRVVVFNQQ